MQKMALSLSFPVVLITGVLPLTSERLLFKKVLDLRHDVGFRHELGRRLKARPIEFDSTQDITMSVFGRKLHTSACDFDGVLAGQCSIGDYCAHLATDSSMNAHCQGDLSGSWQIVIAGQETCRYVDSEDDSPFNEAVFSPEQDYCLTESSIFNMTGRRPVSLEKTTGISRPFVRIFKETRAYIPFQTAKEVSHEFSYDITCSSIEMDGTVCRSCGGCPEGSTGTQHIDCSNIDASLVSSCDQSDSSILGAFINYVGVECSFGTLMERKCSLGSFCSRMASTKVGDVVCFGDISKNWFVSVDNGELCFYATNVDAGMPFDNNKFNPSTDYCMNMSLTLQFWADTAILEEYIYETTRPLHIRAIVREMSELAPCDVTSSDYVFEKKGYCYHGCPAVSVGGAACSAECIRCPDSYYALDCSNVDSTMVESCGFDHDDNFAKEAVAYFERRQTVDEDVEKVDDIKDAITVTSAAAFPLAKFTIAAATLLFIA
jgi:hypothetical protein